MSTDLMLRCVSHDPYISSDDVGRNLSYLTQVRQDIKDRDKLVELYNAADEFWNFDVGSDYRNATIRFLAWHPRCELEIWDEYGTQYSLEEPEEENDFSGIGWNTVIGKALSVTEDANGVNIKFELNDEGLRLVKRMRWNE